MQRRKGPAWAIRGNDLWAAAWKADTQRNVAPSAPERPGAWTSIGLVKVDWRSNRGHDRPQRERLCRPMRIAGVAPRLPTSSKQTAVKPAPET
jgi:hypothetical protein